MGASHLAGQIIGDHAFRDGPLNSRINQVRCFLPAQMFQEQGTGKDQRPWVYLVLAGILRGRAMGGFKDCAIITQVGPRGHAQAPNLGRQGIGKIIPVQDYRWQ